MPLTENDYVSEEVKIKFKKLKAEGIYEPEPYVFTHEETRKPNLGKEVKLETLASDKESFTGKEEGFFSKFGSNSTK